FENARKGAGFPGLSVNKTSSETGSIKVKAGDELSVRMVVMPGVVSGATEGHELAVGDRIVAVVTVGEGENAVSAKITAIVGDLKSPELAVDFPLDKSVTRAESITVS